MIKISKEFKKALAIMEDTKEHLFLTGNAGTGKSTLLQYFRKHTAKKIVVLAPTGVAALNVKGQTIHSFFGFNPSIRKENVRKASVDKRRLFESVETIVIDEISMVRADLLDCIDKSLRINRNKPKEAFGGVQMIFIGDLFQLPPVLTDEERYIFEEEYRSPYFFSAYVLGDFDINFIELKKVYRQQDNRFVELLNNLRNKRMTASDVQILDTCHDADFDPGDDTNFVHLTTTNKMAEQRNYSELQKLEGEEYKLTGTKNGDFRASRLPSEDVLKLKVGARVMFTNNDSQKRWVNGTLGTVTEIKKELGIYAIYVELANGKIVPVNRHTWEMFEYSPSVSGEIGTQVTGSYRQYPLTLAWAVTIHKAQGKTFDKVLVDMGWGAFAHGQMYVALSRCTSLDGLVLRKPFREKDVIVDSAVIDYVNAYTK
ncbi:AAA family ATPase [Candidatus Uhrbacteria bacterium CG_4_9_14_3_um_filter_41_35]|uniref:AAA family ATPase n=1 Tax=Candidatus Uhrbacteria bacterium CG_4_9_14_3_um_filter_41_35 TaxID=1975034 RepID=A0A2M7XD37_9BACT|nr:MAG: AAA family ATPase [Candidatus Uhrbacteria bacterium CG11_big_fil_rev_8_21_14_0_20_41_9]PJA45798.1 MAG: AAA family ATPase [Candidatus Uhrbacteria bacterium CG_4_9_14_3_um_filter_41_35]